MSSKGHSLTICFSAWGHLLFIFLFDYLVRLGLLPFSLSICPGLSLIGYFFLFFFLTLSLSLSASVSLASPTSCPFPSSSPSHSSIYLVLPLFLFPSLSPFSSVSHLSWNSYVILIPSITHQVYKKKRGEKEDKKRKKTCMKALCYVPRFHREKGGGRGRGRGEEKSKRGEEKRGEAICKDSVG